MQAIPPTGFNIAFGAVDKLATTHVDDLLPAIANDLVRGSKPEQIQQYLGERAQEIRSLAAKNPRIIRIADKLDKLAEEAAIDAELFAGLVALAFDGGTRIEPGEAEALIVVKDWIIETAKPVDKKPIARKMLAELELIATKPGQGEGIATAPAQLKLDELVAGLEKFIRKADDVSADKVTDLAVVAKDVEQAEINSAMHSLIRITTSSGKFGFGKRGVGKRGVIDHAKIDWFKNRIALDGKEQIRYVEFAAIATPIPALADVFEGERVDLIAKHIDALEEFVNFSESATMGYSIFEIEPMSIPSENVRIAAKAAAKAINRRRACEDGQRLNCFELRDALAALDEDGNAVTKAELLEAYHELGGIRIDGEHEATALEALRAYLGMIDDFMKDDENVMLCAGFTTFEIGNWSPNRRPETVVATYFPLPNEKGEVEYEIEDIDEAKKIHDTYADDLSDTGLNCVTFEFDKRVWVAVYPKGDLESIKEGRTEIPIFDLEHQAKGSGKVVGKVDPFTSSAGEAVFRTASSFVGSFVKSVAGATTNTKDRGEKLAKAVEKRDDGFVEKFSLLGLVGLGGAAINPAFMWGMLGLAGAPSAVSLAGFAVSRYQLRPIYELLGNVVVRSKKL